MTASRSSLQLAMAAREFAAARDRTRRLLAATTDAQWITRPASDSWSAAECLAHLNLTSASMVPALRAAFEEARQLPSVGQRAYRKSVLGAVLAASVGPAPRLLGLALGRTRTATQFVPGTLLPRAAVETERARWMDEEAALVLEATGLAIDRVRVESPFRAGAFYDAWSALLIIARHEHRHLEQAERANRTLEASK